MHHLHNLQQVLLAKLGQCLGQLLHVHVPVLVLANLLLFRLSRSAGNAVRLGRRFANIAALAQRIQERALGIPEGNVVCAFVAVLLEVQVVRKSLLARLRRANGRELDLHVELSPSFLVDGEGRAADGLAHALGSEGVVENVGRFLET